MSCLLSLCVYMHVCDICVCVYTRVRVEWIKKGRGGKVEVERQAERWG